MLHLRNSVSKKKARKEILSTWRPSKTYEKDFELCFGAAAENRTGDLCPSCKSKVTRYRGDREKTYADALDSNVSSNKRLTGSSSKTLSLSIDSPTTASKLTTSTRSFGDITNTIHHHELGRIEHDYAQPHLPTSTPSNQDFVNTTSLTQSPSSSVPSMTMPASPTSPKKRLRDESPPPSRSTRPKNMPSTSPSTSNQHKHMSYLPVLFLGCKLPGMVVDNIFSFLDDHDIVLLTLNFILPDMQNNMANMERQRRKDLSELNNVSDGELSRSQKQLLGKLIKNREKNVDRDGCIVIPQLIYLDNLQANKLWLHVAADKGGKTTKLILQVINQKDRHSIDFAKLIGYFEGKDNRANLEAVFGPVLTALQECVDNIAELNLQRPLPDQPTEACCKDYVSKCDDTIKWKPLQPFNQANATRSEDCNYCTKKCCSSIEDRRSMANSSPMDCSPLHRPSAPADVMIPSQLQPAHTCSSTCTAHSPDSNSPVLLVDHTSPVSPKPQSTPSPNWNLTPCHTERVLMPNLPMPQSSPPSLTNDENQSSLKTNHPSSKPSEVQSKPPTCLETPQRHHSNSCRLQPRNLLSQLNSTKEPPSPQKSDCNLFYTACCLTTGGDWEGLAKFVGLSGPNGKFFCNHCLATLDQVPKGMPHAAHILPKYNQYAQECEYTLWTFDGAKRRAQSMRLLLKLQKQEVEQNPQ
ncbi:uncharacterized protein [Amphiura filiformis]|uniref:uncharacterized protein n=1 Tax=Amphiura filiformis TaxID=82378 RepID=UPI003B216E10